MPPPPVPPPLKVPLCPFYGLFFTTVPHKGQKRFTGTISWFRRRYEGPNMEAKCPIKA